MIDVYEDNVMLYRKDEPKYIEASKLRINFLKKYIIDSDPHSFQTQVERDWAYIARREYRYKVTLRSMFDSFIVGMLGVSAFTWYNRKLKLFPLLASPVMYFFLTDYFLFKHNKRFFDMTNIGEQYLLGAERNKVLELCNNIQGVQDF
jgi:hypothetical protein